MQSPLLTAPLVVRVFPPKLICARMGNTGQPLLAEPEKLPALFTVKDRLTLSLSVTVTGAVADSAGQDAADHGELLSG